VSVSFKWQGVAEQLAAFATLPEDLTAASSPEVHAATEAAAEAIRGAYPPGQLRAGVQTVMNRDREKVFGVVINTSPLAALYEYGSQTVRHTASGANRGSMPAHPVFVPTMIRERRALLDGPIPAVMVDAGLKVTGRG
jgi:hypothetical protein